MMILTFEEKYQAIVDRDSSYEGLFITAVKTTGIFCRPVCSARKPKINNVEFFNSPEEAIDHGYRPCKICKPMERTGEPPEQLKQLIDLLENNPKIKLSDNDLRSRGLEPNGVRRWFKKNYGMTFQEYQRRLRLNNAHNNLRFGKSVTHTAFDHGFESLSGFSASFQKVFSASPSSKSKKNIINVIRIITPLGPMIGCATSNGVCMLEFWDREGIDEYLNKLSRILDATLLPGFNQHLESLQEQVGDYFQGKRKKFDLKLNTIGTEFQKVVWDALMNIPYGETRYYSQQADLIGHPKSVRAVASANGLNRIALVIPCHRVIGKDGNMRGYAGGINRKVYLLELEMRNAGKIQSFTRKQQLGIKFQPHT